MLADQIKRIVIDTRADRGRPQAGVGFDWLLALLGFWGVAGAYLDSWAHIHVSELDTFFTPYHAVLYSGFLSMALALVAATGLNHRRGYPWLGATPAGYDLSLLGVVVFFAGGFGDLVWHTLFGIEAGVDALLSPTHLMLALGGGLMVTGPLRSSWRRPGSTGQGWWAQLPAVLSLAFLLSMFAYFTQFAHPWARPYASVHYRPTSPQESDFRQSLGVAAILLQTGILMGVVLLGLALRAFPRGGFTLLFTLSAVLMALNRDQQWVILPVALSGLGADLLYGRLKPVPERPFSLRLFAFAVPVLLYSLYFLGLLLTGGVWWSVHLWAGSIFIAGIVGWLASYLAVPPRPQAEGD